MLGYFFMRAELQGFLQAVEPTLGPRPLLQARGGPPPSPSAPPRVLTSTLSQLLANRCYSADGVSAAGRGKHGKNMAGPVASWEM